MKMCQNETPPRLLAAVLGALVVGAGTAVAQEGTATLGTYQVSMAGAWRLQLDTNQAVGSAWNVTVVGAIDPGGRLFSTDWAFAG